MSDRPPVTQPAVKVLSYADRDAWDRMLREADGVARGQALIAAVVGLLLVLVAAGAFEIDARSSGLGNLFGWVFLVSLVAVPFTLAAFTFVGARRLHIEKRCRRRYPICEKCGYDLRASEGRCPECGQAIPRGRTGDTWGGQTP